MSTVQSWLAPTFAEEMRSFFGLISYFWWLVQDYALITFPLHRLPEKDRKFVWTVECQKEFEEPRNRLTESPVRLVNMCEYTELFVKYNCCDKKWGQATTKNCIKKMFSSLRLTGITDNVLKVVALKKTTADDRSEWAPNIFDINPGKCETWYWFRNASLSLLGASGVNPPWLSEWAIHLTKGQCGVCARLSFSHILPG